MTKICCFDTNMISYLLIPNPNDPNWEERSKVIDKLINELISNKTEFYLPSIVLFELLMAYEEEEKRHELFILLTEMFRVASFDISSAIIGAEILSVNGFHSTHPKPFEGSRQLIKTDAKILATAVGIHSDTLYTNNKADFSQLAEGRIILIGLEDLPYQPKLL